MKTPSIFMIFIIIISMLPGNVVFALNAQNIDSNNDYELKVAEYILSETGLDILPHNHIEKTITTAELIDILIKLTNISDDNKACALYNIGTISTVNVLMYEDFHISAQKEEAVRRLIAVGILPNTPLIFPNENCTWSKAVEIIMRLVDRNCIAFAYGGYVEYAKYLRLVDEDLAPEETSIYDGVKKLLFYSLFQVILHPDYSIHGEFAYKSVSDVLYLCYGYHYKLGYAKKEGDGILIDDVLYEGNADINSDNYIICIYEKSNDSNKIVFAFNINSQIYTRIRKIKSLYKISPDTETIAGEFSEYINIDIFCQAMRPVDIESIIESKNIELWKGNEGNVITRAQVVKTAFQVAGNDFNKHKLYPETLPFKDVTKESVLYYNYISAAYNAGAVIGDGNGYFFPDRACTYGEAIKIFCCLKGWGDNAEELASASFESPFPTYYAKILEKFDIFEFGTDYNETQIKNIFPQIVWHFMCVPEV